MSSVSTIISKPSRRRPVQKSSSGCKRCRLRKIKCDEGRPSCTQCKNKQFDCPGYPSRPVLRWSTKHEVFDSQSLNLSSSQSTDTARNEFDTESTQKESLGSEKYNDSPAGWLIPDNGPILLESDIFNAANESGTNGDLPPNDDLSLGSFQSNPPNIDGGAFLDLWGADSYGIIPDPGDIEGSLQEDQDTLPGTLPSSVSSTSSPCPSMVGEEALQQTTEIILGSSNETVSNNDKSNATFTPPRQPPEKPSSPTIPFDSQVSQISSSALCLEPCDASIELVSFYFNVVCHILSTFDSEQNVFRTYVSKKWQSSAMMFHTIQSMAAAKMVWFMPEMRTQALEFRLIALNDLQKKVSVAQCWDTELLFIVLLLGISSSWFDITDLGIPHLQAVQKAVLNKRTKFCDEFDAMGFFQNALIYWEMVSCAVSNTVTYHDCEKIGLKQPMEAKETLSPPENQIRGIQTRIVPHPWTGVASEPQAIFTLISRQINGLRSFGSISTSLGQHLDKPDAFVGILRHLDQAIWSYKLPKLHDISNIGDPDTPAIHHLLLAEAYMYANTYQLYGVFSSIRRKRLKWMKEATDMPQNFDQTTWAGSQVGSWTAILRQEDGAEKWLQFLGRSVIIRLEQIQINSGTSCVQALLLLVAATSLSLNSEEIEEMAAGSDGEQQYQLLELAREREDILQARKFVLDRLELLSILNLSAPIRYVRSIVLEIFKRLDVGVDLFWMDVLYSMGVLTIIG